MEGDPTGGDWYAVAFKAHKSEDDQAFVMATVDVANDVVASVSVFRASWETVEKNAARLNMQEFRNAAVETKNKTMVIREGKAYDEQGHEINAPAERRASSVWGTQAYAAVSGCDVTCTVVWATVCWFVSTLLSGGLLILVASVACGVVALYYCDYFCDEWYKMVDTINGY